MKQIGWVKCRVIHEELGVGRGEFLQSQEEKLIHEHDLITKRLEGTNYSASYCITCNYCYCNSCGKLVE